MFRVVSEHQIAYEEAIKEMINKQKRIACLPGIIRWAKRSRRTRNDWIRKGIGIKLLRDRVCERKKLGLFFPR